MSVDELQAFKNRKSFSILRMIDNKKNKDDILTELAKIKKEFYVNFNFNEYYLFLNVLLDTNSVKGSNIKVCEIFAVCYCEQDILEWLSFLKDKLNFIEYRDVIVELLRIKGIDAYLSNITTKDDCYEEYNRIISTMISRHGHVQHEDKDVNKGDEQEDRLTPDEPQESSHDMGGYSRRLRKKKTAVRGVTKQAYRARQSRKKKARKYQNSRGFRRMTRKSR